MHRILWRRPACLVARFSSGNSAITPPASGKGRRMVREIISASARETFSKPAMRWYPSLKDFCFHALLIAPSHSDKESGGLHKAAIAVRLWSASFLVTPVAFREEASSFNV
jgi:hypothetical protein